MSVLHVLAEQDHRNPAWQDEEEGDVVLVAYTPILELLVEAGVDPNASNAMGEVPPFCCLSTNTRQTLIRCRTCVVCVVCVCVLADRASPALLAWPQGGSVLAAVAQAGAQRRRHQRVWRHGPPLWYAHTRASPVEVNQADGVMTAMRSIEEGPQGDRGPAAPARRVADARGRLWHAYAGQWIVHSSSRSCSSSVAAVS
jgi:hypothetical protein